MIPPYVELRLAFMVSEVLNILAILVSALTASRSGSYE